MDPGFDSGQKDQSDQDRPMAGETAGPGKVH